MAFYASHEIAQGRDVIMAVIAVRTIRAEYRKQLLQRSKAARDEVIKSAQAFGKDATKIAQDIVANWEHKPEFKTSLSIDGNAIIVLFEPVGDNAKYWKWTSEGTKKHKIVAKTKPMLVFKENYEAKTTVGPPPTWGGSGERSGGYIVKKAVNHPGTKARNFERFIRDELITDWRRGIENAFRRGVR